MGQTLVFYRYHTVFSTKNRRPMLTPEIMPQLIQVVGGIIRDRDGALLAMNGTGNHVHLLTFFHQKRAVADVVRDIKAVSSDWIHARVPGLSDFAWQNGYGSFTVSKSLGREVERYIANQQKRHQKETFEHELIALLDLHEVEYDPDYVLD